MPRGSKWIQTCMSYPPELHERWKIETEKLKKEEPKASMAQVARRALEAYLSQSELHRFEDAVEPEGLKIKEKNVNVDGKLTENEWAEISQGWRPSIFKKIFKNVA